MHTHIHICNKSMLATSFPEDFKICRPSIKWNEEITHQKKKASALRVYFLISFSTSSKRIVKVLYMYNTHTFLHKYMHTLIHGHTSCSDTHLHESWGKEDSICQHELFFLMGINIMIDSHYEKSVYDSTEEIHRVTSISVIFSKLLVFYHSGSCVWRYINFAHLSQGGFTTNIYMSTATNELHALCLHQ